MPGSQGSCSKGRSVLGCQALVETACRMYAPNMPHLEKLITRLNLPESCLKIFDRNTYSIVFQVMQQRCVVSRDEVDGGDGTGYDPLYLPANIWQEQTARNIVHVVDASLPPLLSQLVD